MTVLIAFTANVLVAVAKSIAALLTGSASMGAEAAHSWSDTCNQVFLLIAQRRSSREPTREHPLGFGRESYIWSLFAAIGLFAAGATVSIVRGVDTLLHPEPGGDFLIAYIVLGLAFVFEGSSFVQAFLRTRRLARRNDREILEHAWETSDSTLRAVFAEDSAALIGIIIAAAGIAAHQLTGSSIPDAIGSLLIGVLLAVVAVLLVDRNRRFLVGEEVSPAMWEATMRRLADHPEVERVDSLLMEYVGPDKAYAVASVDIRGDEPESTVSDRLRAVEGHLEESEDVVAATLTIADAARHPDGGRR